MLAKGVIGQQQLLLGHICNHVVGPVQHRRFYKLQGVATQFYAVPALYYVVTPVAAVVAVQPLPGSGCTDHNGVGISRHHLGQGAGMVRLDVVDNDIVSLPGQTCSIFASSSGQKNRGRYPPGRSCHRLSSMRYEVVPGGWNKRAREKTGCPSPPPPTSHISGRTFYNSHQPSTSFILRLFSPGVGPPRLPGAVLCSRALPRPPPTGEPACQRAPLSAPRVKNPAQTTTLNAVNATRPSQNCTGKLWISTDHPLPKIRTALPTVVASRSSQAHQFRAKLPGTKPVPRPGQEECRTARSG